MVWRGAAVRFGFLLIVPPLGSLAGISLRKRLATLPYHRLASAATLWAKSAGFSPRNISLLKATRLLPSIRLSMLLSSIIPLLPHMPYRDTVLAMRVLHKLLAVYYRSGMCVVVRHPRSTRHADWLYNTRSTVGCGS